MKRDKWVCIVAMLCACAYCFGLIAAACGQSLPAKDDTGGDTASASTGMTMGYEERFFDTTKVHTLDIQIDKSAWSDLKENALEKNYHDCTLVVDGEAFSHVGVRTKGNSTLLQSIIREWDRHSLVFNFGEFNKSQRYYGLDKISLYNNACDSSYLRDMICFDLMRQMGIPTPLCSYTAVYLNGEYLGLYMAMEGVDTSFAVRNFGYDYGQLYKPEEFDLAAILTGEMADRVSLDLSQLKTEDGTVDILKLLNISTETVALQYQGDKLSAYQDIWDNAIFKIGKNDKKRLVAALKDISERNNLENVVDMDELARYFAVNAFALNTDDYSTVMAHNYYLYEKDGKLRMLPWDYDQTMGTVGAVGASEDMTVFMNLPIDTPVTGVSLDERPMLACLLGDEEGLRLYHQALETLMNDYVTSGYLSDFIERNVQMITSYVENDPTGPGMEKFKTAVQSVKDFYELRSQSINGQLSGSIPATAEGQEAQPETRIAVGDFSSPDSVGFIRMIVPEDSDIGIEDGLRALRLNTPAVLKMLPVSALWELKEEKDEGEDINTLIQKAVDSGRVNDEKALRREIRAIVFTLIRDLMIMGGALIALAVALICVFRFGKNRRPQLRKEKRRHAV